MAGGAPVGGDGVVGLPRTLLVEEGGRREAGLVRRVTEGGVALRTGAWVGEGRTCEGGLLFLLGWHI